MGFTRIQTAQETFHEVVYPRRRRSRCAHRPRAVGFAAEASAQRTVVHERTVVRHNDNRPGVRHRTRTRQVCRNVVRNHHRQRVCRTVRVNR